MEGAPYVEEMNLGFKIPFLGAGRGDGVPGDEHVSEPKRDIFSPAQVRKQGQIRLPRE